MANVHTYNDLKQLQALPLEIKLRMSEARIRDWVSEYGVDGVYVSFSGGKDSTVLLDIVRSLYPEIPAVFIDTGLEYPEIRSFVKTFDNVIWLKPKMNFRQVIEKYGYPFISKEVSQRIYEVKACKDRGGNYKELSQYKRLKDPQYKNFRCQKYSFFLEAPFKITHKCCNVMKKAPLHTFSKQTKRVAITGQMANESKLRLQKWLQNGCNAYEGNNPISNPLSFWTDQDILKYINDRGLTIASVYGDIVPVDKQLNIFDECKYKTTGCNRTGCMFCGFGCHLDKESRFVRMKETHPKQYEYIMRDWDKGGLGYKNVIDWINEHGNLNIKY